MTAVLVLLAIVAIVAFWGVGVYNRIIALCNYFENAFSQIDVQLKRRYDLIPNLVETAKAYMAHERETLEAVIAARNHAVEANKKATASRSDAAAFKDMMVADSALDASLGKFFALSEAYPDLKANHTMMQLSEELSSTENRIAFARQAYNDSVMSYNVAIQQFPGSLIANSFGFRKAELLESTESPEERKAIKVTF